MILYHFLYDFEMEPKYDILMIYFLKLITMMSAWKIKNQLILNQEESAMLLLEGDEEEVKERKVLKILAPNKLLTRFPNY